MIIREDAVRILAISGLLVAMLLPLITLNRPAGATILDDGSVGLHDAFPSDFGYVADVGFEGDLVTPFDDQMLFGRGDAISAPGPWLFPRLSNETFSVFSNADDANFDAV